MKKKRTFIVLAVILLAGGIMAVFFFGVNRRSYELHLPPAEKLTGISVEKGKAEAEITDGVEMEALIYVLSGSDGSRSTKEESISDAPRGAEELLKVDFHFAEKGTSTLFVFRKGEQYYMEQPYNGIYRISGDEFNAVEKYVR